MKRYSLIQTVVLLLAIAGTPRPSFAETGYVTAVMTRAGLIAGFGAGRGTLIFRGHSYQLIFSGTGFGVTIGVTAAKLKGIARHMQKADDIEGTYSATGTGAALVAGFGAARLRNGKGVVLELSGPRVGVELSMAMSGVVVRLR
jgi:hypothetical protein